MEKKKHTKPLFTKMLVLYLLLVIGAGGAMLWAAIRTQVVEGDKWREIASKRETTDRVEPARRGTIFSSDGKVLATTVPVCDLCLDLRRKPKLNSRGEVMMKDGKVVLDGCITDEAEFEKNLGKVCKILHTQFPNKSEEYYRKRIWDEYRKKDTASRCWYVERKVPYSQWEAIRSLKGWGRCVVAKTAEGSVMGYVRAHIYGNLGENVVGQHYVTDTYQGYTGLEGYYDSVLRGQDGMYRCRRLTMGTWLPMEESGEPDEDSTLLHRRVDGKSIIATIDTRYQDIAESALRASMNEYGGQRGCAIVMEVATGYVLVCSNLTRDTSGALRERLWSNMVCSGHYEPGSTFKTVAMVSMLNDKQIALDTNKRVRVGGVKEYGASHQKIDAEHGDAHDTANLPGILRLSSNVGMTELAWEYYRNRREDFKKGIMDIFPFGLMKPDLAVQETPTGVVPLRSDRDFLNLSYGYSCTITPLQMITFYNAIAAGGRMVKPLFCREILDGGRRRDIKPVVLNEHVCSEETAKQMREMLVTVVEKGTGNNIYNSVYGIGGKTGTALHANNRAVKNSSFVGFFPADNPRYTCMVLLEGTSKAGRYAAAPVFKKIADCVVAFDKELGSVRLQESDREVRPVATKAPLQQLQTVHQLLGMPFSVGDTTASTGWMVYDNDREGYLNYTMPTGVVPDCKGMTIRDAMRLLRGCGYKVRFSGQGKVVSQTPKARTAAKKGATVMLELK
jgi:cell division protein FtsI (penicillin-binding protein 3)